MDTDHFRKNAPDDKGGVTEADYGIANLGSIVQMKDDIDCRIVETVSDVYVGIVKLSKIVDTFDDMIDIMAETKPFPKFAGIITGPSRTADIECRYCRGSWPASVFGHRRRRCVREGTAHV